MMDPKNRTALVIAGLLVLASAAFAFRLAADVNRSRRAAALYAAISDSEEAEAIRLLEAYRDVDFRFHEGRQTPLIRAAASGRARVVAYLLERRADVNLADANGRTALHHAAREGHGEAVRLLLEHGADPSLTDRYGKTPGLPAAEGGGEEEWISRE